MAGSDVAYGSMRIAGRVNSWRRSFGWGSSWCAFVLGSALGCAITGDDEGSGERDTHAPQFAGLTQAVAVSETTAVLSWTAATDDQTPQARLRQLIEIIQE